MSAKPKLLDDVTARHVLVAFANLGTIAESEIDKILGSTYPLSPREIAITLRMGTVLEAHPLFELPEVYALAWTAIESGEQPGASLVTDAVNALDGLDHDEVESLLMSALASLVPEPSPLVEVVGLFQQLEALNPGAARALLAEMRAEVQHDS